MFSFLDKKKTWGNWYRAGGADLPEVIAFLSPVEYSCISISSRLTHNGVSDPELLNKHEVYIEKNSRNIISLLMLSTDSVISAVFTSESSPAVPAELLRQSSLFRKRYLTLMGMKQDVLRLEDGFGNRNKLSIDYFQLTAESSEVPERVALYIKNKAVLKNQLLTIERGEMSDLEKLMPLRKAYEIEEVLLDKSNFSEQACRNRFRNTIVNQHVFYAAVGKSPVATCCINSEGLRWFQIGGVYTKPELRSQGISARLMSELASTAEISGKDLTLFVKQNNKPALKLYSNCGFHKTGEFRITYAERR